MKKRIYYIAVIPVMLAVILWLLTQAFHLISAPSDSSVLTGVILLSITFIILITLLIFIRRKLF